MTDYDDEAMEYREDLIRDVQKNLMTLFQQIEDTRTLTAAIGIQLNNVTRDTTVTGPGGGHQVAIKFDTHHMDAESTLRKARREADSRAATLRRVLEDQIETAGKCLGEVTAMASEAEQTVAELGFDPDPISTPDYKTIQGTLDALAEAVARYCRNRDTARVS